MEAIAVIGIDLAKSVFQVHGVDAQGQVIVRKRLSRAKLVPFFAKVPPCLVGMETCASANYWARELMVLGHEVRQGRRGIYSRAGPAASILGVYDVCN